jgi:hypothetical protein
MNGPTIDEYLALTDSGWAPWQINRLALYRWVLIHEGRIGNRLATRDTLRIRQILPPRREAS